MAEPTSIPRSLRIAEHVTAGLALVAAALVIRPVVLGVRTRIDFPGDLEWMEGATLITAERIRDGLPIYGEPAPDYIPFIYPPLYAAIVGALGHVFPVGYTLGRTVSVVSILIAAGALVYGARRERASWPLALSAVGLLAATWDDSGTFFDLVRTDSLSLALVGWALVLGNGPTRSHTIVSGLLLAVAFTAKQHAALIGIPIGLWTWRTHGWRRAATFAAASAGPALLYTAMMLVATGGTYWTWIATIATEHGIVAKRLFPGAQTECWKALPLTTTLVAAFPMWCWKRSYWAANTVIVLVIVSLMRGHTGGYLNVLMPMMWVQALLPFVAASAVAEFIAARDRGKMMAPEVLEAVARVIVAIVITGQLLAIQYPYSAVKLKIDRGTGWVAAIQTSGTTYGKFIPTEKDRTAVARLIGEIASLPGPVFLPHAPWYARMAGKQTSFSLITMWDIDHVGGAFSKDVRGIDAAIAEGYFKSAVVPEDKLGHGFNDHFVKVRPLSTRIGGPKTGWPVKLKQVWLHQDQGGSNVEAP